MAGSIKESLIWLSGRLKGESGERGSVGQVDAFKKGLHFEFLCSGDLKLQALIGLNTNTITGFTCVFPDFGAPV